MNSTKGGDDAGRRTIVDSPSLPSLETKGQESEKQGRQWGVRRVLASQQDSRSETWTCRGLGPSRLQLLDTGGHFTGSPALVLQA